MSICADARFGVVDQREKSAIVLLVARSAWCAHLASTLWIRAPTPGELVFDPLIAAVDMVDAVDDGFAARPPGRPAPARRWRAGRKRSRRLRSARAARRRSPDGPRCRMLAPMRTNSERVHEAVLEDLLGDQRDALGLRHQGHVLRLQVGGEAGILLGGHVHGAQRAGGRDAQARPVRPRST